MTEDGALESELLDLSEANLSELTLVTAPALRDSLRRILTERHATDQYAAFQSSV
ncbi:FxSxx-COOH cyclophane-containing RiPP peptide [Actinosynnema sp. NPDC050436]|uniref:FxSxx-COOH cyclophane-containing RiPP peptide n=1 Tax=Actinosynnema sp. NPDC050436 TaxID=3155659 RepID=UPI0034105CE0